MSVNCTNTENILQVINQKFIALDNETVKYNKELLETTLKQMVSLMKNDDPLFETLYEKPYYGGSFYDNLRVGKPDEFDLDLQMKLPKLCETTKTKSCECIEVVPSNQPGFLWFKVKENHCSAFNKYIKNGYVQTDLVLSWLQSLIHKALNAINKIEEFHFSTPSYSSQSGPALTLELTGDFGKMKVDLVPAFIFGEKYWPGKPYRPNPFQETREFFFIVPKKAVKVDRAERYWRASFQSQEGDLINGKERLKPALKLLKKMRSNLGHHSISSYALKTIVLWEVDEGVTDWNQSLSDVFLTLLEAYQQKLNKKEIPYYWNKNGNVLKGVLPETLENHYKEITRKITKFKDNCDENPFEIAKIILKEGTEEYNALIDYCTQFQGSNNRDDSDSFLDELLYNHHDSDESPSSSLSLQPLGETNGSAAWWVLGGLAAAAAVAIGVTAAVQRGNRNNRNNQ